MAFGVHKAPRFGEKEGKGFHRYAILLYFDKESELSGPKRVDWKRNDKSRQTMKDMFDLYYFRQKKGVAGRNFFFVFQTVSIRGSLSLIFLKALPVMISRLLEVNSDKLENTFM